MIFPTNRWPEPPPPPGELETSAPAGSERPIPYQPHTEEQRQAVRRWLLKTDVEELAEHLLAGVDLDAPPLHLWRHLVDPPSDTGMATWRLEEATNKALAARRSEQPPPNTGPPLPPEAPGTPPNTGPPNPPVTKTPSAGMPFHG